MSATVEQALAASPSMLTVGQLCAATAMIAADVKAELKTLAHRGQLEHIPGRGHHGGRYGLIQSTPPAAPAAPQPAVGNTGSDASVGYAEGIAVASDNPGPEAASLSPSVEGSGGDVEDDIVDLLCSLAKGEHDDLSLAGEAADEIAALRAELSEARRTNESLQSMVKDAADSLDELGAVHDILAAVLSPAEPRDPNDLETIELAHIIAMDLAACRAKLARIASNPAVDVMDAARGYIVLSCKRKPRRITNPADAVESAKSAIRAGAQRSEVFALVPVGVARRGAEWRDA